MLVAGVVAIAACKRDHRATISPEPIDASVDAATPDARLDATSPPSPADTEGPDVFAAWPIDEDAAAAALGRLSPTVKALRGTAHLGYLLQGTPTACGPADPDCEWEFGIGIHEPESFNRLEACGVHAFSGEVKCGSAGSMDPRRTVGFAKPAVRDAGADTTR
jgi:hypothetical protein